MGGCVHVWPRYICTHGGMGIYLTQTGWHAPLTWSGRKRTPAPPPTHLCEEGMLGTIVLIVPTPAWILSHL